MSIEQTLERIATSCERNERLTEQLIDALSNAATRQTVAAPAVPAHVAAAHVVAAPAPVAAPIVEAAQMGNAQAAPIQTAPVTATASATQAPAAPTPATASPSNCPITDQPSLIAYVMESYKAMGPVKGNQIQGVLAALGITNINEATTAHYPAIYAGVEALKVQ